MQHDNFKNIIFTTIILLSSHSISVYSKPLPIFDFRKADREFIKLSSDIYKEISEDNSSNVKSIGLLHKKIKDLQSKNNSPGAIRYITRNIDLVKKNIDHESFVYYINILLSNNEWHTASKLLEYVLVESDKSLASNIKFIFAKHYFNKGDFKKSLDLLRGINQHLSINNGHYALIMMGVILQKQKKHRESLKFYDKVPTTSKYYGYAQLNKAIVYIRQGWWSDAHIIINSSLKTPKNNQKFSSEFINRLYLVIGYSFLQQEYFREARESFRNVKTDSIYANRALLGIALSAANQGDNTGALNILNILQNKNLHTLPVEETYLLLPYIYERIGQHKTASASYSIALNYYQKKISKLKRIVKKIQNKDLRTFHLVDNKLKLNDFEFQISNQETMHLLRNKKLLNQLIKINNNPLLSEKASSLAEKYNHLLSKVASEKLKERISFLESYQNQSQYGVARLYDNSQKSEQ